MPTIRPFRTIDEHDVINLFSWSGAIASGVKGTVVKIVSGWRTDQNLNELGMPTSYGNTVSLRYGVAAQVGPVGASGNYALGILLYDVKETDENGEKLLFNPTKAAQMQCVLSGQAVPIATKGMFLYSGVAGTVTAGCPLYAANGVLSAQGNSADANGWLSDWLVTRVGKALGTPDANDWTLVNLDFNSSK